MEKTISKKNIIRILIGGAIILFGIIWSPESESTQMSQYFLVGNIVLIIILMELLPLWFSYYYRTIISLLKYFSDSYDEPLQYSYTPVVVIRSDIYNTENTSYLTHSEYKSDKSIFTVYHEGNLYEFSTDLLKKQQIIDLASVIIYYLQKDIPYEILHQHSKRLQDNL